VTKPYLLGLTGSIGMGKSTTAAMFADLGVPVWDADAAVRKLYAPNGEAAKIVAELFPTAMDGAAVSRAKLRDLIAADPKVLDELQKLVHPLVAQDRQDFIAASTAPIVLLDIPLLFETGSQDQFDGIVVVTASADVQKQRVLARGEMTEDDFNMILARQMPDAEKRQRATWIIETISLESAAAAVKDVLQDIEEKTLNA